MFEKNNNTLNVAFFSNTVQARSFKLKWCMVTMYIEKIMCNMNDSGACSREIIYMFLVGKVRRGREVVRGRLRGSERW